MKIVSPAVSTWGQAEVMRISRMGEMAIAARTYNRTHTGESKESDIGGRNRICYSYLGYKYVTLSRRLRMVQNIYIYKDATRTWMATHPTTSLSFPKNHFHPLFLSLSPAIVLPNKHGTSHTAAEHHQGDTIRGPFHWHVSSRKLEEVQKKEDAPNTGIYVAPTDDQSAIWSGRATW